MQQLTKLTELGWVMERTGTILVLAAEAELPKLPQNCSSREHAILINAFWMQSGSMHFLNGFILRGNGHLQQNA